MHTEVAQKCRSNTKADEFHENPCGWKCSKGYYFLVSDLSSQTDKNTITDDHLGELITCIYTIYGNMPI